jgi:hypothetical protein
MTKEELENWHRVHYRMDEEGFQYCFESYSHWHEIKDEKFHELRLAYLNSAKVLREYIESKVQMGE